MIGPYIVLALPERKPVSSHTDKDYLARLRAIVTVTLSLESSPRSTTTILAHPYKQLFTPWRQLETAERPGSVPFGAFSTEPSPQGTAPIYPSTQVAAGFLAMNRAGNPVVLVPAYWGNRLLQGIYRERSLEGFLDDLTLRAKCRQELVAIEAAVWKNFGQHLSTEHAFKEPYEAVQKRMKRLENSQRRRSAHRSS